MQPFITYKKDWRNSILWHPITLRWKTKFVSLEDFHLGVLVVSCFWPCGFLEKRERGTFEVYDLFRLLSKFLKFTGRIFISANGIECSWPFQWNQLMPCELKESNLIYVTKHFNVAYVGLWSTSLLSIFQCVFLLCCDCCLHISPSDSLDGSFYTRTLPCRRGHSWWRQCHCHRHKWRKVCSGDTTRNRLKRDKNTTLH